jgi:hypothetical protein
MTMILTIPGRITRSFREGDFAGTSRTYSEARDASGEGASTFPVGIIRDRNDRPIARVSFNGRIWRLDPDKPDGGGTLIYCPGSADEDEGRPDIYNEGRESVWGRPRPNPHPAGSTEHAVFERGAAMARRCHAAEFTPGVAVDQRAARS